MKNNQLQYLYKNKNDSCSCYISKVNMMQYKHDICLTLKNYQNWNTLVKEKEYNLIFKKGLYNSPTIVRYNKMESVSHDEQMFCNESEITNNTDINDDIMNNNELQNMDDSEIENTSPDKNNSYFTYSVICESLYSYIKTVLNFN